VIPEPSEWKLTFCFFLMVFGAWHLATDCLRPWAGVLFRRAYGMQDISYIASKLPKNLPEPIWTDDPPLYFEAHIKPATKDFIDADEMGGQHQFPSNVKTRIELVHPTSMLIPGWTVQDIALSRGEFPVMRIWRR